MGPSKSARHTRSREGRAEPSLPSRAAAFSLIELVVILVVVGVLAVFAVPALFSRAAYDTRGYYDEVGAALRFAQKAAIAQRRIVCVTVAAGSVTLMVTAAPPPSAACGGALQIPGAGSNVLVAPAGVTLSPAAFQFSALGQASAGTTITVTGESALPIIVESETGHVH